MTELAIGFPRVHDIGDLLERLPEALRPRIEPVVQEKLTYYAVASRYPGDAWATHEDAETAVAAAHDVRAAIVTHLSPAARI